MKGPICHFCWKDFSEEYCHIRGGGRLVRFQDYRPLPPDLVGHPHGLEWFCRLHVDEAERLSHLNIVSAMAEMQIIFGDPAEQSAKNDPKTHPRVLPSLWVLDIGPHRGRVFAAIRMFRQISPAETKRLMEQERFPVVEGFPQTFGPFKNALEAVGATTEIRYD